MGSDSNAGTSAGAGNAFATFAKAATSVAAGDLVNVIDSGVYTWTTALAVATAGTIAAGPVVWRGYSVTPGDGGKARITSSTTTVNLFGVTADYNTFDSFALSHTGATRGSGFIPLGANRTGICIKNCTIDGCLRGIDGDGSIQFFFNSLGVDNCEIKNCTSHGISNCSNTSVENCFIHNNVATGFAVGAGTPLATIQGSPTYILTRNVFYANSYHLRDTLTTLARWWYLIGNTFHSATNDALKSVVTAQSLQLTLCNNIIYGQSGWGIELGIAPVLLNARNNAYGANTLGNLSNLAVGAADVALLGDPCTTAGTTLSGFIPNNTTGAGKLVRNAGINGVDIGAMQHADPVVTTSVRQPRYRIGTGS